MDKQLKNAFETIEQFKKRMINTNLNLNSVVNNFPLSRSAYFKHNDEFDGDSINELILDYIHFFNNNKVLIESKLAKKQGDISTTMSLLVDMYVIYNELVNYADLMLVGKYQESIDKQYSFLSSRAFLNLIENLPENRINEIKYNNQILCMLSILHYKKVIDNNHPTFNQYLQGFYQSLNNAYKHGKLTPQQYQYVLLIEAFYYFINGEQRLSFLSLGLLYHDYLISNETNIQHVTNKIGANIHVKSKVSLQFIGLGKKPYITMTLPSDFKKFIHYTLSNITQSKQDLLIEKKKLTQH